MEMIWQGHNRHPVIGWSNACGTAEEILEFGLVESHQGKFLLQLAKVGSVALYHRRRCRPTESFDGGQVVCTRNRAPTEDENAAWLHDAEGGFGVLNIYCVRRPSVEYFHPAISR